MSNIRMQIKDSIMHYLCDDWNNHKRGKSHKENQALFDRKDGYAIWNNTDLEMIMEKVVKGIYAVDLSEHDKQIEDEAIQKFAEWLDKMNYLHEVDIDYDWEENPYETVIGLTAKDVIEQYLEHIKGK